jgi:hypothetical protein
VGSGFPRDNRLKRRAEIMLNQKTQSAMPIQPNLIAL